MHRDWWNVSMNNAVLCSKKWCCSVLYSYFHSVVLNNDEEALMEYKMTRIWEDPEFSYWTMDPSEIFSVWSTPYLMEGSL